MLKTMPIPILVPTKRNAACDLNRWAVNTMLGSGQPPLLTAARRDDAKTRTGRTGDRPAATDQAPEPAHPKPKTSLS